jgi:hypothetical protein
MKSTSPILLVALVFSSVLTQNTFAEDSTFTYQGRLTSGNTPANAQYEMNFTLYDAPTNGTVVGGQTVAPVTVTNGFFTAIVDFGSDSFNGSARWLEISLNLFGTDMIPTTLVPRQQIFHTPYAIHAANAASLSSPSNAPLEIKVNGARALRIEPTSAAPNLIGGHPGNGVSNGVVGAFIGGGGLTNFSGAHPNRVNGNYGAIVGGTGNSVNDQYTFIGGGQDNRIASGASASAIVGGSGNQIARGAIESFIGGGLSGLIDTDSTWSVIAGGYENSIGSNSAISTISGGLANRIDAEAQRSTIAGGSGNSIGYAAFYSFIGGGQDNIIHPSASVATISGGEENSIYTGSSLSTIAGGEDNVVNIVSPYSSIGGGYFNIVQSFAPYSVIGGGTFNTVESEDTTISGGRSNAISFQAYGAVIGGGIANAIDSEGVHSTISGGFQNFIVHDAGTATIAGGRENRVTGDAGTISGGWGNVASDHATVSGGSWNYGEGSFGTIGGGSYNTNNAEYASLGGGFLNTIVFDADYATLGGGIANFIDADADRATIAGGNLNFIGSDADAATITGGENNSISQSCPFAFIGGGKDNRIEKDGGQYATIAGGFSNTNRGQYATIPGGRENIADRDYTFAAGRRAHALHPGAFVWADSSDFEFRSANQNEWAVRATGGARFVSAIDSTGSNIAGVTLAPGAGAWSTLSDRNAKENVSSVNARDILDKVAALPMATWNYKSQDKTIRHMGPMAQDFKAAFELGENDRTITTVDADGVALAAIQGLNQKMDAENKELRSALQSRDATIADLQKRLSQIESILGSLASTRK